MNIHTLSADSRIFIMEGRIRIQVFRPRKVCSFPSPVSFLLFSFPLLSSSFHERLLWYESLSSIMASSINPTSIPPITVLRQELDYGDPKLSRCQAFCDSVRAFRKTFVTSQGLEGGSLHDWRSREHQTALGEMVRSYLDVHVNGRLFWPDDNSQGRFNKLKYSTDSAR